MAANPTPTDADVRLWDALPGMVLLLAADGAALKINDAFCAFVGRTREDLLGYGWSISLLAASHRTLLDRLGRLDDFMLGIELRGVGGAVSSLACVARRQAARERFICILHNVGEGVQASPSAQGQASLFRLLADNVPVLIAYYNATDFRCQFANKRYAETFGRDEDSILGSTFEEVIGIEAAREIQPQVERMLQQLVPVVYERTLPALDGSIRWIEVHLLPHLDPAAGGSAPLGAFVLISDISKFRLAEQAVRESEERLAKFMQASAEGIVFHKDGFITDANPPVLALLDYTLEDMMGRKTIEFIAPDHIAKVAAVIASGQETAYESMAVSRSGERIPVEFIVRTMVRNGERMRMTIVRDIRDRHATQAHIHHLAHHDSLTGLPNRASFMEHLERSILGAQRNDSRLALLFIDLDHFKRVNDSLGHLVGDSLLRSVAARITANLRGADIVARFGGDEFMVLLAGLSAGAQHANDAQEVAHKLLNSIGAAVQVEGRPISVMPSVGIALYPGDGATPEELVKNADSAMYLAKARGRANCQFFEPGIAASAFAELVLESELAQALERGELVLHYQPQVRARDGMLMGAEALIRWNHSERGLLLAGAFIPVAEKRQLMIGIGQWVLHEAARCAMRWRDLGLLVAPVAVNLSNVQFQAAGFLDSIARELPGGASDSGLLELELTERMLMDDLPQVKYRLERLKDMGLRISVDDFGTGYSSLGHLKNLPIDKVKIDRSFVHDLPDNRDSAAITRAIIQMGSSLGLTVIAEGVETQAQRSFLDTLGCDELQGMLISPPLPQPAFEAWVLQRQQLGVAP